MGWRAWTSVTGIARRLWGAPRQASIWAAYRAIGLMPKITGFGRLLESLA